MGPVSDLLRRAAVLSLLGAACTCSEPPPAEGPYVPAARCPLPPGSALALFQEEAVGARFEAALDAFDGAFDAARWDEALSCAQEASRLAPDAPVAHLDRALAFDGLGLWHEARLAYGRALALAPLEPEVLRAYGDFLEREGTDDGLETALLLARRGREAAEDPALGADLALVEARAANALGHSERALSAAETALALDERPEALVERGVALFELTRLEEADRAFAEALTRLPDDPRALHWAGLVAEHLGRHGEAMQRLARAAELDPEGHPRPLEVSPEEFAAVVETELLALPAPDRARLETGARLESAELPAVSDLREDQFVLSPTILGLFRPGPPGGRSDILLYRKNILRVVRDREELRREVRDTLLHELGHLAGETDAELRDRGL